MNERTSERKNENKKDYTTKRTRKEQINRTNVGKNVRIEQTKVNLSVQVYMTHFKVCVNVNVVTVNLYSPRLPSVFINTTAFFNQSTTGLQKTGRTSFTELRHQQKPHLSKHLDRFAQDQHANK